MIGSMGSYVGQASQDSPTKQAAQTSRKLIDHWCWLWLIHADYYAFHPLLKPNHDATQL